MNPSLLSLAPLVFLWHSAPALASQEERIPVSPAEQPEELLPPGMNETLSAEWKLRDFEGRWVIWQQLVDGREDAEVLAWHNWLAERGEYSLLERDALDDTGWGSASALLQQLDAPQWLRLAQWHSNASDSHTWDAAKSALESRPKLTLSWIEANPQLLEDPSTKKLYDALAKQDSGREECAKYLPPHELKELYEPLVHAGDGLVDFGSRLVATHGERYVHQTLHAIQVLAASKRRPAVWERRLFDLANAKNLEVRLAALQASTRLDPESLPWTEFRALFDSRGEPDVVRGAAWIALTYAPRVIARRNYLEVLADLGAPEFSEVLWMLFIERLPEVGGWYENQLLHEQPEELGPGIDSNAFIDAVDRMMKSWDTLVENNVDLAVQSELELFSYLRAQHEGLQELLSWSDRPRAFANWIDGEDTRHIALQNLSQNYIPQAGVFPGGDRAPIDGAGRDLEAWKLLVIREAESLLTR